MNSPIEPTQVWTREEWLQQAPWGTMPKSKLRDFFKSEMFAHMYSRQRVKVPQVGDRVTVTGRFKVNVPPPQWVSRRE